MEVVYLTHTMSFFCKPVGLIIFMKPLVTIYS
jgi:hypothetical protein